MTMLDIDATDREMIERGDRIGADLARQLLRFYDERAAAVPSDIAALVERLNYHVGNPSAWDTFDDGASELMRESSAALTAAYASLAAVEAIVAAFVRAHDEGPGLIDCIDNDGERYTSAGLDATIRAARRAHKGGADYE